MGKTRIIGFNPEKMKQQMLAIAVDEQSKRLVEYAKQRIMMLGEVISMYNSRHNMDRTGNLLDSLCWGVLYNGKYVDKGFYREKRASESSGLHEWWTGGSFQKRVSVETWKKYKEEKSSPYLWESVGATDLPEIWGHELAQQFLNKQEKEGANGWKVFFAILAPYWGYWEKGFTMKGSGGWGGRFLQFAVMTQFRDHVSQDLKPARVRYGVTKAIDYSNMGLMKQARTEMRKRERESNRRRR